VSINTAGVNNPQIFNEASHFYGAQCVVAAIDAKKRAEEALANRNAEMDYAAAEAELAQAVAQLATIKRVRHSQPH